MILMTWIGWIPKTGMKDQYSRIRMVDNIKVNIQQIHGPRTIKLAQWFCLAVLLITFLLFQDFIKYLYRQIHIWCTTSQQCKHCKFFNEARMFVNINVLFCFTATTAPICVNTWVHQIERDRIIVTPTTQLQCHYVITATLLIQRQHVNMIRTCYRNVKVGEQRQHVSAISRRHWNVKVSVQRQSVM